MARSVQGLRLSLGLLVAALCASDGALVRSNLGYFKNTLDIRLDPAGLKVYRAARSQPPPKGPLLVFFGDSRALMWNAPPELAGYETVNRGIGNQTTAQILLRVGEDVAPLRPSVVVLEAGVNDLKSIAEFRSREDEIVSDCEANIATIVEGCRKTGARVVLLSVFDLGDVPLWRQPFWSDEVGKSIARVNAYLPSLVRDGVVLFDANEVLAPNGDRVLPPFQLDYLHLSSVGYQALTERLTPLLPRLPQ